MGASSGEDGVFLEVSLLDGDCLDCENATVTVASREAPDAGTQINGSPRAEIPVNMDYIVIHQAFLLSLLSTSPPAIHQLMHQKFCQET